MAYTFDSNVVSDLHKDAYGFRPSTVWWRAWRDMDDAGRQEEWDRMCLLVQEGERARVRSEAAAQERWEAHIAQLMLMNRIDRATALRWDMDALDCQGDAGYYCFQWGISYHNEQEIRQAIEEMVSAA